MSAQTDFDQLKFSGDREQAYITELLEKKLINSIRFFKL